MEITIESIETTTVRNSHAEDPDSIAANGPVIESRPHIFRLPLAELKTILEGETTSDEK